MKLFRDEGGYSLVELLAVMGTLGAVIGAITSLSVAGSKAEVDMSLRFQAQSSAKLAMDWLRRDAHTACSATPTGASTTVTLASGTDPNDPETCVGGTTVTWCTVANGNRFDLKRLAGAGNCSTTGRTFTGGLVTGSVFTYQAPSTENLGRLQASLGVRLGKTLTPFQLCDVLVLRNTYRTGNPAAAVACPA